MVITIDSKVNIHSLEQGYNELTKSNSIDIIILKGLTGAEFGLIPAIIQFFATWYNKTTAGKIIIDIKSKEELSEFYESDYLFPSIVYCWNREITNKQGEDLKPLLKVQNELKHEKMKMQTGGGGFKALLSCFDHLSVKKGLLNAFYIDGIFISNEMQFDYALGKSIRQVTALNRNLRVDNLAPFYDDVVAIIYELMKNTDDWGKTDEFNKPINPNSRGLFLKLHRRTRDSFKKNLEDNKGLKNYFSVENFESNDQDELYFLELSVYDTGIGFVKRNVGGSQVLGSLEQVEIVRKCLIRNNTTATGIDRGIKGQGLNRIMKILDNRGLFWLRTQNISIFRNLRENRYKEDTTSQDIELFDWFTNSSTDFSVLASSQGSLVTLVYPISNIINA